LTATCGLCLFVSQPESVLGQVKGKDKAKEVFEVKGEPKGFKAGEPARYAVWASKTGWHVRTTTARTLHHFTGKIHIEGGVITGLEPHDLEFKGKYGDWWRIHEKRHEITIDFKTDRHIDGIDFQVSKEAKAIHWNLWIDGKHHADKVFIGKTGHHPLTDPFIVPAHPKK